MRALLYLNITKLKNTIKDLRRHPARLILSLLVVALIVFTFISGKTDQLVLSDLRDIHEVYAICFFFYGMLFITSVFQGFSSGATFFGMVDVNMLFQSPISPKRILIYGLIKQMISSIWIGFFILFQYAWMHNSYGMAYKDLIFVFLGYCITFFCSTLTSMAIYSFTCNSDKRRKYLKIAIFAALAAFLAIIVIDMSNADDMLKALVKAVNAPWINFIPIVGWLKAFATGAISGNLLMVIGGLGAVIAYVVGFIFVVGSSNTDYYEDVLQATEVSYSAINASKEGRVNDAPKNVKVGKTGINKGSGANAFFYKHLIEDRRSGLLFLDRNTIIFMITSVLFAFFMKGTEGGIIPGFAFATYMQLLTCALGRWIRELTVPYVYLLPEKPFKKLVCICKENMLKIVIEAIIVMTAIGLVVKAPVADIIACIIARISLGIIFMAGNVLIERIFGTIVSKVLIMFLYFLTLIVVIAPGIVGGIFLAMRFAEGIRLLVAMTVICVWNIAASALIGYLCRDILNYAELNNN